MQKVGMAMLKRLLVTAFSIVFCFQTTVVTVLGATTQDQLDSLQLSMKETQSRILALEAMGKSSNKLGDQVLELLKQFTAQQEAMLRTSLKPEVAKTAVNANKEVANKALDVLNKVKVNPESLGKDSEGKYIIDDLLACVGPVVEQAKSVDINNAESITPDLGSKLVQACSKEKLDSALDALKKNREDTLKAYNSCRDAIVDSGKLLREHLPEDPADLSPSDRDQFLANLKKFQTLAGDDLKGVSDHAKQCGNDVEKLADSLKNMDNSAAATAAIMNMAGTICMASGANPYVCAGAFVVAFLMQIFGGGNGDGTGDGNQHASLEGEGGVLTSSPGSGKTPKPGPVTKAPQALGGNIGDSQDGNTVCDVVSDNKLSCSLKDNSSSKITIDPMLAIDDGAGSKEKLIAVLRNNDGEHLGICGGAPSVAVRSIIIFSDQGFMQAVVLNDLVSVKDLSVRFVANKNYSTELISAVSKVEKLNLICKLSNKLPN